MAWAHEVLLVLAITIPVIVVVSIVGASFRKWQWKRYVRRRYGNGRATAPD